VRGIGRLGLRLSIYNLAMCIIERAAAILLSTLAFGAGHPEAGQLASRPADEWIKTLDGAERVASLKIDEVVAAMRLRPGERVADIGAGSGLFEVPLAKTVGSRGIVYAVDIDAGFFPEIKKRASQAGLSNVQTVLGKFTDPALPERNVDVALLHDVLHHIADRQAYLSTLMGYLAPKARVVVVDYEGSQGPHPKEPELQVTREQLTAWMTAAGLTQIQDVKLFPTKFFLIYARQ
jgi:ubiquinone/menaquinone biosynthesis C-methylase UbiE